MPDCQVLVIISAIQTNRINLSPFTKDFRVWVAIYEISIIYPQAVPSGTATYNYQKTIHFHNRAKSDYTVFGLTGLMRSD